MKPICQDELISLVIRWVATNKQSRDSTEIDITPETNLISTGLVNSFGFIDLMLFIESQTDCPIDLTDVDPGEFAVVRGLCKLALRAGVGDYRHAYDQ